MILNRKLLIIFLINNISAILIYFNQKLSPEFDIIISEIDQILIFHPLFFI